MQRKEAEVKMRILIINPNSDQATETILRETAEKFVQKRFEFDVVSMTTSPKLVVSYEDQYASAAELAQTIRRFSSPPYA